MHISSNNYSVIEIIEMIERKELFVNTDYQRGSGLWPDGPSSYFIDTILENFPFPKIYMFEYMDQSRRRIRKEIVDGQQRIKTIVRFFNNEFKMKGDSNLAGLRYSELDDEKQNSFLSYTVSVDVIRNANRSEILQMFRRMNAYTLPLNEAEKRHSSFQGPFKWFINSLANKCNEFFVEFGVFSNRQIVRMADAELLTDCILATERGIVSTSPSDLRALYRSYDDSFGDARLYEEKIQDILSFISSSFEPLRGTHMMRPYALHSLVTCLYHNKYKIDAIEEKYNIPCAGIFSTDPEKAGRDLLAMAQAHEAKEEDGPYRKYIWGCQAGTNRSPRREARVLSIFDALGVS